MAMPVSALAQTAATVPQVSTTNASRMIETPPSERSGRAPKQLSKTSESSVREKQLTSTKASQSAPRQVGPAIRNALPPQPLSVPSQGRTAAVEHVKGSDRCDPALPARQQPPACADVIEGRAAEFARPEPVELSPEQRLLLEQELQGAGENVADATRRLATSGQPDSAEAMGIASIVLDRQVTARKPDENPADDAAAKAIIDFLAVTPLPPQQ